MKSLIFLTFLITIVSCHRVSVKPDSSGMFMKMFGDADNNFALAAEETEQGNFILVGTTISPVSGDKDILLVKTDKNGNRIWQKKFGGSRDDEGFDVKIDADGGYLVLGYMTNDNGIKDIHLIKTNTDGDVVLTRTYGDPAVNEEGRYIRKAADGKLILGAISQKDLSTMDMYFIKTDLFEIEWNFSYGVIGEIDEVFSIEEEGDDVIICGSGNRQGSSDMRVIRANKYGTILWDYAYGFNNNIKEIGYAIKKVHNGFVVVGTAENADKTTSIYLIKIDNNGNKDWDKYIREDNNLKGYSLDITNDGGIMITGSVEESPGNTKICLIKTDANGNISQDWPAKYFGGGGANYGRFVKQTQDNGFLIFGTSNVVHNDVMILIKTNANGELVNR